MTKKKGLFNSEIWNDISKLRSLREWYLLNKIAKECKKTPTIMEKRLDLAVKEKILERKGIGRKIFYKLNPNDQRVKNMLAFLKEEK